MIRIVKEFGLLYIKTEDIFIEFQNLYHFNPMLYKFVNEFVEVSHRQFGVDPVITSLFRKKTNDSGVHAVWRACDFRSRNYSSIVQQGMLYYFNNNYQYDFERPGKTMLILHGKGMNEHFHMQVHPQTVETIGSRNV